MFLISNEELHRKVVGFQNFPCDENEHEVVEAFKHMAGHLLSYYASKMDLTHIRFDDLVCFAMERVWHYDPVKGKGKAFNYFSTSMMCHLRQVMRREKNYAELREKYKRFLEDKTVKPEALRTDSWSDSLPSEEAGLLVGAAGC